MEGQHNYQYCMFILGYERVNLRRLVKSYCLKDFAKYLTECMGLY